MNQYFPVVAPYRMPGPLLELGAAAAGTRHIEVDGEYDNYVGAKGLACGRWWSPENRQRLEPTVAQWLGSVADLEHPGLLARTDNLDEMVMGIQEDLVVMHREPDAPPISAQAVYVNACFPTGWCPDCVTGMAFMRIHAPVPNVARFGGTGRKEAAQSLFSGTARVRFIWTITPDNTLDRRRCERTAADGSGHESRSFSWEGTDRYWLRVERQVIAPIDESTSCFLIRVYHYPVAGLGDSRIRVLHDALASMPDTVRRYKGLPAHLDLQRTTGKTSAML